MIEIKYINDSSLKFLYQIATDFQNCYFVIALSEKGKVSNTKWEWSQ